ncbi:MAG: caspase family protein [Ferruginibacter sp.]
MPSRFTRYYILFPALLMCLFAGAQIKKYALIIGIDTYRPAASSPLYTRNWSDLEGCVNDATAIKDFCTATFGFSESNIITLFNQSAERDSIINALEQIIAKAVKGDVVFVYYAGHGSQVKNSLSSEKDKKDETIVPADHWKSGVADIRDKELAVYFNRLSDKGVLLTVIFDSCHSGSIGRGGAGLLAGEVKARYMEDGNADAMDATVPLRPEERGALIISAAQDFEFAKEQKDENNISHGAFTLALLKALQQQPAETAAGDIFKSLTAIMKYYGKTQEPVLAGNNERKRSPLFGSSKQTNGKLYIASGRRESKGLELMGGFAFGLSEGSRLAAGADTLEIIEMKGANRSVAKAVAGDIDLILPGTLFEPVNWVNSRQPALRLFIPVAVSKEILGQYIKAYQQLKSNKQVKWITDISKETPDHYIYFEKDKWYSRDKKAGIKELGDGVQALQSLSDNGTYYIQLPPTSELTDLLKENFTTYNNVVINTDAAAAQYILTGTVNNAGKIVYAFTKNTTAPASASTGLPARTDFVDAENSNNAAAQLGEAAFKIARIRDWLLLTAPGGENRFPFVLDFNYYRTGRPVVKQKVKTGDTLTISLREDTSNGGWQTSFKKRYVYVFSIDSRGAMNLLFPSTESGNTENRLPVTVSEDSHQQKIVLTDIEITPPAGSDHYFMLSSEQAISDLSVFNQEAVMSRGPNKKNTGDYNPVEAVLYTGSKTRGQVITPVNWSLYKTELISTK